MQQQKGAGAEFHLLFAAGLPSEQDQALSQLIVLEGRGQAQVFSLEKMGWMLSCLKFSTNLLLTFMGAGSDFTFEVTSL